MRVSPTDTIEPGDEVEPSPGYAAAAYGHQEVPCCTVMTDQLTSCSPMRHLGNRNLPWHACHVHIAILVSADMPCCVVSPVEDAIPVHVVECLHQLVHVRAHTLLSQVVPAATYQLINVHVLQNNSDMHTMLSCCWLVTACSHCKGMGRLSCWRWAAAHWVPCLVPVLVAHRHPHQLHLCTTAGGMPCWQLQLVCMAVYQRLWRLCPQVQAQHLLLLMALPAAPVLHCSCCCLPLPECLPKLLPAAHHELKDQGQAPCRLVIQHLQ